VDVRHACTRGGGVCQRHQMCFGVAGAGTRVADDRFTAAKEIGRLA